MPTWVVLSFPRRTVCSTAPSLRSIDGSAARSTQFPHRVTEIRCMGRQRGTNLAISVSVASRNGLAAQCALRETRVTPCVRLTVHHEPQTLWPAYQLPAVPILAFEEAKN